MISTAKIVDVIHEATADHDIFTDDDLAELSNIVENHPSGCVPSQEEKIRHADEELSDASSDVDWEAENSDMDLTDSATGIESNNVSLNEVIGLIDDLTQNCTIKTP